MKKKFHFLAILLACLFFAKPCFTEQLEIITGEEYEVYSAVLSSEEPFLQRIIVVNKQSSESEQIIIEQTTLTSQKILESGNICTHFNNLTGIKLGADLCEDFAKKNQSSYKLENKFSIPYSSVIVISAEELKEAFSERGWFGFYKKYPDSRGTISLSRVGFNAEHTRAFLCWHYHCGGLCGRGVLVLLFKEDGQWKIKRVQGTWKS